MRLRSSQFVFLLLLVCSVQVTEQYTLNMIAATASGSPVASQQRREVVSSAAMQHLPPILRIARSLPTGLDSAFQATDGAPQGMQRPASEAAAVSSYTSFQRD